MAITAKQTKSEVADQFNGAGILGEGRPTFYPNKPVKREGLNQLMADVEANRTNFSSLLVYDVSRWGRFRM